MCSEIHEVTKVAKQIRLQICPSFSSCYETRIGVTDRVPKIGKQGCVGAPAL